MAEQDSMKASQVTEPTQVLNGSAAAGSATAKQTLVSTMVQQQQKLQDSPIDLDELEPVPAYNSGSFLSSLANLFKASVSPKSDTQEPSDGSFARFDSAFAFYFYHSILVVLYLLLSAVRLVEFSINRVKLRFLNLAYNPSRTPVLINSDVNKLPKIPFRFSAILSYKPEQEENGGVEGLCNDASEVAAWCLSAGIPNLSIYEYHGVLKKHVPELRRAIYRKLVAYFGTNSVPTFVIKIPHLNLSYAGSYDGEYDEEEPEKYDIEVTLLSVVDGRATIVELTKVISQLYKSHELSEKDISIKFIDQELQQLVGSEPDLIVLFQPYLNLQGYPPWHTRLSEMYWEPDNEDVTYAVFLRALQKYSTCKVNVGR